MITKDNAITASSFEHISLKNSDKTPLRGHRNGKTITWKTRPTDFKIPCKYGLYEYFYIDQNNAHLWNVAS